MRKKISPPFSISMPTFQPIFELFIGIDMNAIANPNVKSGTQFIAVDRNVIANLNVKLYIALYCNGYNVQELLPLGPSRKSVV